MAFFDRIFGQPSARVIALARLGLAGVFFVATLVDQESAPSALTIPVLTAFLCFSMLVAYATWSNWWVDARIAITTHVIDMLFFISVVGSPGGYSSPYFLFFVFLLLAPAIRWTWRETAVTAAIVVSLYIVAGLAVGVADPATPFDARRFIIRSGYLLILSVVLIWFGVRRRFSGEGTIGLSGPDAAMSGDTPVAAALRQAMTATRARQGLGFWRRTDGRREAWIGGRHDIRPRALSHMLDVSDLHRGFLFDAARDRALVEGKTGYPQFTAFSLLMAGRVVPELGQKQGLAIPVHSKLGSGLFLLWDVEDLHSDHLALGERLRGELASMIERYALFSALRDGAIARERLGIARDLHDGVVQFLAGSAYKIEAISRSSETQPQLAEDLQELKRLMLMEQEDLRSSIGTLRKDKVSLVDTEEEAVALCQRLERQWRVHCSFAADVPEVRVPARLHMTLLHMIKESVANAARHASADHVQFKLSARGRQLELVAINDVAETSRNPPSVPWSIRERVAEVGGSASVQAEGPKRTLTVSMPIPEDGE